MDKIVCITGATSGIGRACAFAFAKNGDNLILTGRRGDRLRELAGELQKEFSVKVLTLCFDIRNKKDVDEAIGGLTENWKQLDVLINNAGLAAGLDPIQHGSAGDWDQMIDTNVKGLLYITRAVVPAMIARSRGHIINIGSVAGKEVYAKGNVYSATKFAVDALTKGMRIDLLADGIKVSQVSPGAVETEFSLVRLKGDEKAAEQVYKGFTPLTAEDIASSVYWIASQPEHVNINDLVIMPVAQASPVYWNKKV
jgi:NADP-dependent 3-hydroxy acid dehydrogenase YdfG